MTRRHCPGCCDARPCGIFADDFNREDSTDLGDNWNEAAGDWEIKTNRLQANGAGTAVCTVLHPVATPTAIGEVDLIDVVVGQKYRVFVNADEDGNDYDYAEFERTGGSSFVRVGTKSGGQLDEVELGSIGPIVDQTLIVCRNRTGIYGNVAPVGTTLFAYACVGAGIPENRYSGVAAVSSGTHKFDNFDYKEHDVTVGGCGACHCSCDYYCVPKTLYVTLVSLDEDCDCLEAAASWPIFKEDTACTWKNDSRVVCDPTTPPNTTTMSVSVGASENNAECGEYWIEVTLGASSGFPGQTAASCICSPFRLESEIQSITGSGDPPFECSFYAVITT